MPERQPIVSHIAIEVDGEKLSSAVLGQLLEVTVDQHVHLPSMFSIRLYDPEMKLLDGKPFNLASEVKISSKTGEGKIIQLIKGEVTALEPNFDEGMIAELTVRGYDRSHRLYRERKSATYLNVKDSDIAQQIAKAAGLKAVVDATPTVYDHIYQCNESDLSFLRHRAWRIGYECFAVHDKLHFRKPVVKKKPAVELAWGDDLISLHPRVTVTEQVKETLVKGWDIQKKAVIIGRANAGRLYPKTREQKDGQAWAGEFGQSRMVIVDQPVVSQAEADIVAAARFDELSGAYIEAEGEAFRRPDIQAGEMVKIDGLGKRLSGVYLVTRATHVYSDEGLKTFFGVTGARTGLLTEQLRPAPGRKRWPGAVSAIVTNTDDPNGWGRVKVKYPRVSDTEESNWARVVCAGTGPDSGLAIIPAVDDEVMVVFEQGDFNSPVVLGGVWNGQDALPEAVKQASDGEKPLVRSWTSRTGHRITMYDNADNKIEVVTAGGLSIVLDDTDQSITVKAGGDIKVEADGNLNVKAGGNLDMKSTGTMNLSSDSQINVKATKINLN